MTTLRLVRPYQTVYTIKTNDKSVVSALCLKFGQYISKCNNETEPSIVIEKVDDRYLLSFGDLTIETKFPIIELTSFLFQNTEYASSVLPLHGAAVEHRGKAHIFLAATGTGKTTLTSYLHSNGFGYLTDDCVLLDRTTLRIHPYPRPMQLRIDGLNILKNIKAEPKLFDVLSITSSDLRYVYTPFKAVDHDLPISGLYFISRNGNKNYMSTMKKNELIAALLKTFIVPQKVTQDYIRDVVRLSSIRSYRLNYTDMKYVAEIMQSSNDERCVDARHRQLSASLYFPSKN